MKGLFQLTFIMLQKHIIINTISKDKILQNMLLGETFRMIYFKCVSCNDKLVKIAF